MGYPSRKKNGTKAERAVRSQKASAKRRVALALAKFLKQANPGRKVPANVRVKRLKGGGFSITPIKTNPSNGPYYVRNGDMRHGPFSSKREAQQYLSYMRKSGTRGGRVSST